MQARNACASNLPCPLQTFASCIDDTPAASPTQKSARETTLALGPNVSTANSRPRLSTCPPYPQLCNRGASGAGKTTLLDILACNVYAGSLQGEVLVDGAPREARSFLQTSCYVMQKDLLYASATVGSWAGV